MNWCDDSAGIVHEFPSLTTPHWNLASAVACQASVTIS